jgi:lantibiotic leader peptide-processing serine protease
VALEAPESPRVVADVTPQGHVDPASAVLAPWQWNMFAINADAAWDAGLSGDAGVTVAILDTGIDYDNPDMAGLVDLSRSASFVPSDDAITAMYFPTRHPVSDYHGHGTNVASQVSSNAEYFAGVTSHTTLMAVKVLGGEGTGSLGGVLFGMLWAADNGADVINMSLGSYRLKAGGGGQLQGLLNSVFSYVKRAGALVVVSAGNESVDLDHNLFPDPVSGEIHHLPSLEADYCTATHVVCVSSVGPVIAGGTPDIPSIFTNFGRSAIDVAGPGGNVGSTVSLWPWGPGQVSWVWSLCSKTTLAFDDEGNILGLVCPATVGLFGNAAVGTSQAAPHVAGLAALLIAERGGNQSQIGAAIRNSAVHPEGNGNDPYFGKGRIDVARALGEL